MWTQRSLTEWHLLAQYGAIAWFYYSFVCLNLFAEYPVGTRYSVKQWGEATRCQADEGLYLCKPPFGQWGEETTDKLPATVNGTEAVWAGEERKEHVSPGG